MDYKMLLTRNQIIDKVFDTAREIATYLKDNNITEITVMPIMNGSIFYAVDLMRELSNALVENSITCKIQMETIRIKSYENNSNENTKLTCKDIDLLNVKDINILIVDDVYDTGKTFKWLVNELKSRGANIIISTVFVDKTCNHPVEYKPTFASYVLNENKFLVGYGMNDNGYYRELPELGYIEV